MEALAARLREDKLQTTADLACLAALPALATAATEKAATAVIEQATTTYIAAGNEDAAGKLQVALARRCFASGRVEEGRKIVRSYLETLDRATAAGQSSYRYYGGIFRTRRENLQVVALESARGGQWDDAMDFLGQTADLPPTSLRTNPGAPPVALILVARHLATLPVRERYDKLRAWTMPNDTRATVRLLATFAPIETPPESFGRYPTLGDGSGVVASAETAGRLRQGGGNARRSGPRRPRHRGPQDGTRRGSAGDGRDRAGAPVRGGAWLETCWRNGRRR